MTAGIHVPKPDPKQPLDPPMMKAAGVHPISPGFSAKRAVGLSAPAVAFAVPSARAVQKSRRKMPSSIVFHAAADATVPCANSVASRDTPASTGNDCELATFGGPGHSHHSRKFGDAGRAADMKTREKAAGFVAGPGLIGRSMATPE